jgi:D-threonate/D-erythronate kinase
MISIHLKECAGTGERVMHYGQDENYQSPQPVTPVRRPLTIIADDLTGACDAAVAFAAAYHPVRVQITGEPSKSAQVRAITTESRDLPAAESEAQIRSIAERLADDTELFKKVDSVFRGNTVAEIAATLRHARYDLAILAPAYPALGRTIRNGVLHIQEGACGQTIPVPELLAAAGCALTLLPANLSTDTLAETMRRSTPAILCDAATQDDLTQIVHAARSLSQRVLWIGSGGLAHALAAEGSAPKPAPTPTPRPGYTIFFIGSPHPVTRMQVDHLRHAAQISEHRPAKPQEGAGDLLIPVVLDETSVDDIRRAVAAHDPAQIGCLFMTGGETGHFICRALGIGALLLQREFAPGVPLAIAEGGSFNGVSIVLKSGGFGEPDLLCRLLETCRQEVHA